MNTNRVWSNPATYIQETSALGYRPDQPIYASWFRLFWGQEDKSVQRLEHRLVNQTSFCLILSPMDPYIICFLCLSIVLCELCIIIFVYRFKSY